MIIDHHDSAFAFKSLNIYLKKRKGSYWAEMIPFAARLCNWADAECPVSHQDSIDSVYSSAPVPHNPLNRCNVGFNPDIHQAPIQEFRKDKVQYII